MTHTKQFRAIKYKEYEKNSIYMIRNTVLNKSYIGRSVNPKERIRNHFRNLNNGKGHRKMQKDFDKYGKHAFESKILETHLIKDADPKEREDFYIDKFDAINNGYNTHHSATLGSKTLMANVTSDIYEAVAKYCSNENMKKSDWLRQAIQEKLEREGLI